MLATLSEEHSEALVGGMDNMAQHGNTSDSILHQKALYYEIVYWERALSISNGSRALSIHIVRQVFLPPFLFDEPFTTEKAEEEFIVHRSAARGSRITFVQNGL